MANPQKEDGYTPIANDLLEALIRWDGPGRVKDLVLAIMRETYGWSSKRRSVKSHRLCAILEVSERRVRQLKEVALACNLIVADGDGYELQKDFDLWTTPKPRGMSEKAQGVLRRGHSAEGTPQDVLPGAEGTPQDVLGEPPSEKAEGGSAPPLNNPPYGVNQESNESTSGGESEPEPSPEDEAIQMASGIPAAYIMQARLECLPALKERLGGSPQWGQSAAGERMWLQGLANEVKIGEITFAELTALIEDREAGPRTPDAMKPGDWLRRAYAIRYKRKQEAAQGQARDAPTVIGGIIPAGREPPARARPDTPEHDARFAQLYKFIQDEKAATESTTDEGAPDAAHG